MATTWKRSFLLTSITTQNWMGLWIPSPSLLCSTKYINFSLQPSLICQKRKKEKKNMRWEVVARCSAKTSPWKFHKFYREIPVLESSFRRSSRPEVFCKKEVLENFAKFKGKHLGQSLFFNEVRLRWLLLLLIRQACNFTKEGAHTGVSEPVIRRSCTK